MLNVKHSILWGIILYFITFFTYGFLQPFYIYLLVAPVFICFCAYMYFRKNETSVKIGLSLGIMFVIIGLAFDAVFYLIILSQDSTYVDVIIEAYSQWWFYLGFVEVIVFPSITGYFLSKNEN